MNPDAGYFDTMSYCSPNFIPDYHYPKAFDHRRNLAVEREDSSATLAVLATNETLLGHARRVGEGS